MMIAKYFLSVGLLWLVMFAPAAYSQPSKAAGPADWDMLVDAAKKEGKVSLSIPASAEMRKQLEDQFKKRYGVEVEVFTGRGSAAVRRMADEFKAGVRHFDLHIGGSSSIVSGMLDEGILDPIEPWLVLPEVKDPKQWWGGHLWVDNAKRFIYMFQAYLSEVIWYNSELVKPNEIRSFDDFLNPKWKGKIGYLDPRTPGAGDSTWAFMWRVKGEDYLKKLVAQDLYLGRDQRQLAESLAKGRVAVMIGLSKPDCRSRLFRPSKREITAPAAAAIWRSSKRRRIRTAPGFSSIGCWAARDRKSFPGRSAKRPGVSMSIPAF
jgi:ABC-type Fe3+ transport system substrate-binding protein